MFITSPTFFHKLRHTIICIRYVGKAIVNKYLLIVTDFKNFFFIHFMYTYFSCRLLGSSVYPMDCLPHQAPLSMGFPRQEYWSGLPFPSLGKLPNPGIQPRSRELQADALSSEPLVTRHKDLY